MPAAGDDIKTRLSNVERDVAEIRKQLALTSSEAAARVLAAGADRDVSEVRAHTQALNALRETQVDFSRQLAEHGRQLADQGRRIDELHHEMREGFATLVTGMAQITALLTNLDASKTPE
jgi:chromosome segregation ATPase